MTTRKFVNSRTAKLIKKCRIYMSNCNTFKEQRRFDRRSNIYLSVLAGTITTCGVIVYALDRSVVEATTLVTRPPNYPWSFNGFFASLDHSAIRRGWIVYKTVCSACHSLKYVAFRDLVNVCFTEQEARDIAAEYEVEDGPDAKGEYFMRSAKLFDRVPSPFPNEEAARAANNGAYPVDLSYLVKARHNGINYVFGLLTGYTDPPAGVELSNGQAFNPYFENGALGMPEMLHDGVVDYDDGTIPYKSQMAKDVVEFLVWTSGQEWDVRKVICIKGLGISLILLGCIYTTFRQRISLYRNMIVCYIPKRTNCKNS